MLGYRTIFKHSWILITFWHRDVSLPAAWIFLVMCHGCPSHPYDHTPVGNQKLLQKWYILVFVNYLWTWWSDGYCTFDNSIDTISAVIDFIRCWNAADTRSGKNILWHSEEIILIWASFWGSVVLCAWAHSQYIKKIISCSPVLDWHKYTLHYQENIDSIVNFLKKSYNQLWRCRDVDLERFSRGCIHVNPVDHVEKLKTKQVLVLHDILDPQVPYEESYNFAQRIGWKNITFLSYSYQKHILLHHLDGLDFFEKIDEFLMK